MKILISQPLHEENLQQLEKEISLPYDFDTVLYPEGYLVHEDSVRTACQLANRYGKMIITGYRDSRKKDRALIISPAGDVILDRAKTPMEAPLYSPSTVKWKNVAIGYLLCVELLQGLVGFKGQAADLDYVAHPIGVGMFSEEQFQEWITEAGKIAVQYNTMVLGTSHADGSFRNCGVSIPIAYCIDSTGEALFIAKNDVRTRIVDLTTKKCGIMELS